MVEIDPQAVDWLLHDLCTKFGCCMAGRQPVHFVRVAAEGPEAFADAVLVAERLDPLLEKRLRREVREFVAARFERWAATGAA